MSDYLTYEEIINSYEFKLTEKILKREHPWIKKIDISEEDLEKYKTIFLDLYINPYELAKLMDWKINWWKWPEYRRGESRKENFFSIIYTIDYDTAKQFSRELEVLLNDVKKSPAIPKDLKLPKSRDFAVGSLVSVPNLEIPPDAEKYESVYHPYSKFHN